MKKALLFVLSLYACAHVYATPNEIRWGTTTDPLNGLTITWSNNGSGDSIKWGYTTSFEKGRFAGVKRTGYKSGYSFFKYVFATVNASSTLYYELYDSHARTWGVQQTFQTAPALTSTQFTFCALGDCRDSLQILQTISNLASARKPSFALFNGDLTVDGNVSSEYDNFFTYAENFLANNLTFHAQGNHDALDTQWFENMFDLPHTNGTSLYYAVKYGNVLFMTLNTEDTTGQTSWINTTLAAANADPGILWKVISFHRGFFTTGQHEGDMNAYRGTWWKSFDTYGVDLVLNGHDHTYQRSKPINLNVSATVPVAQYGSGAGQGRCEIICGGAGAGLYTQGSTADAWAMDLFLSTYNYTYVQVQDCKMIIKAFDQSNNLLDSLTLDKSGTAECTATGIKEQSVQKFNPITLSPNPANDTFTIHYNSDLTGEVIVRIYDFRGEEIAVAKTQKTGQQLDYSYNLAGLPKGSYTVSLEMGKQRDNAILILK